MQTRTAIELTGITLFALFSIAALSGCAATSVVTEFDPDGNVVKTTETSESIASEMRRSLENKTVAIWNSGWRAELTLSAATMETPTPTGTINAGNVATGYLSVRQDQRDLAGIAEVIRAMRSGTFSAGTDGLDAATGQ